MKYFFGNILALIVVAGVLIWPLWVMTSLHWGVKSGLTVVAILLAAFFVERIASKWVNKLMKSIFPDK